jgi:hypothetical protein
LPEPFGTPAEVDNLRPFRLAQQSFGEKPQPTSPNTNFSWVHLLFKGEGSTDGNIPENQAINLFEGIQAGDHSGAFDLKIMTLTIRRIEAQTQSGKDLTFFCSKGLQRVTFPSIPRTCI